MADRFQRRVESAIGLEQLFVSGGQLGTGVEHFARATDSFKRFIEVTVQAEPNTREHRDTERGKVFRFSHFEGAWRDRFVRLLTDKLLLPGVKLDDELVAQEEPNLGAGLIEAFSYVAAALLIGWAF